MSVRLPLIIFLEYRRVLHNFCLCSCVTFDLLICYDSPFLSLFLASKDEWGAGDCINGNYTYNQQLPDQDLGRSVTVGWRNMSLSDRAYGCPSVRKDVSLFECTSV